MMGWSREKVAQYVQLEKISPVAWKQIVTTFKNMVTNGTDDVVTERILRNLLDLTPPGAWY